MDQVTRHSYSNCGQGGLQGVQMCISGFVPVREGISTQPLPAADSQPFSQQNEDKGDTVSRQYKYCSRAHLIGLN